MNASCWDNMFSGTEWKIQTSTYYAKFLVKQYDIFLIFMKAARHLADLSLSVNSNCWVFLWPGPPPCWEGLITAAWPSISSAPLCSSCGLFFFFSPVRFLALHRVLRLKLKLGIKVNSSHIHQLSKINSRCVFFPFCACAPEWEKPCCSRSICVRMCACVCVCDY